MSEYLSCTETAKLVRQALKKAFPTVKFSVNSKNYAGGASINVAWKDGPATKEVEAVAKNYQGAGFDGMIDLKYNISHWLMPDGSVVVRTNPGTLGNGGLYEGESNPCPEGGREVHFMADFIFCNRDYSIPVLQEVADKVCAHYGFEPVKVISGKYGPEWEGNINQSLGHRNMFLNDLMYREREQLSL
jgi:hypothetical protein